MSDLLVIFVIKSPEIANTDRKIETLSQSIQSEAAIRMGNLPCLVQQQLKNDFGFLFLSRILNHLQNRTSLYKNKDLAIISFPTGFLFCRPSFSIFG
jgi:hypothetical protein